MENNRKYWFFGSKLNTALLLVLIILMVIAIAYMYQNKEVYSGIYGKQVVVNNIDQTQPPLEYKDGIIGNKDDLISFSISPYNKVHGILSYRGVIKGGYFFEANILINIIDINKKVLKNSNAVASTDWMTSDPINFEGNIDFTGLPKGPAYFEIHNDNASGLLANDKSILIPITID